MKSVIPALAEQVVMTGDRPIELERDWQVELVGSTDTNEIWGKARQIGYSFGTALRTLLRAHLFPAQSYNAVLVSINREEAREKVRYVEGLLAGMRERKKAIISNKLELEFDNGNRIQSFPSRSVRGIPNVDLYLDEFAHIKEARTIYQGSTASTIRQSYGVTIGSTPFGRGAFYDIYHGTERGGEYRNFVVHEVPWWHSHILCKNVFEARVFAPGMRTHERVYMYGMPNLIREFESHSLESFQTEFEVFFADFGNSVLTQELIFSCHNGDQPCQVVDIDCEDAAMQPMEIVYMMLREAEGGGREASEPFTDVFFGYDVGRRVHASELILLNWHENKLKTRIYLTLRKCPYPLQRQIIQYIMNNLPVRKGVIDKQGLGGQLAEELHMEFSTRIEPMDFTELTKAHMVGVLVKAFESKVLSLYPTRRISQQLMEVRKVFSENGRILYKSAQTKEAAGEKQYKAHADLFWALAMGAVAADDYVLDKVLKTTSRSPLLAIPGSAIVSGWSGRPIGMGGLMRGRR